MQKSSEIFACQIKWVFFFVFCFANNVNLLLLRVEEILSCIAGWISNFYDTFYRFQLHSTECSLQFTNNRKQRRQWQPTPVLLPGKFHGQRSLVGCSPWGREELDMTERLHFHFSLSCIGEGNGNPLQYSCLENPRDSRAWWAAVYGAAQSRTRLKRLSSSSNNRKT